MESSDDLTKGIPCYIDTGYRTLSNALRKRFREIQVKMYSTTENIVTFGSAFFVDGVTRKSYSHLEEAYMDDEKASLTLVPVYDPNTFVQESFVTIDTARPDTLGWYPPDMRPEESKRTKEAMSYNIGEAVTKAHREGSDSIELSHWKLDFSHFKRSAPTTIRVPVSGKGYAPRFIFTSQQCIAVDINEINWVYRTMYWR